MGSKLQKIIRESIMTEFKNPYFLKENEENRILTSLKQDIEGNIERAYKKITGKDLNLPKLDIKIDNHIKKDKIAGIKHPDEKGNPGVIGVKSKALENMNYLKWVITHELIHASVGEEQDMKHNHSGLFTKIANEIGLPEKYQD